MSYESARKAAETRRLRAMGQARPTDATQERGAGVTPELWIEEQDNHLAISIRFTQDGEPATDLTDTDRAMRNIRVMAWIDAAVETPTLHGFETVRLEGYATDVATLERVLPSMRRLDRFLTLARDESEDPSFAKTVESLAMHLRVARIVHVRDGKESATKRGAAYITAYKLSEAFIASHTRAAA